MWKTKEVRLNRSQTNRWKFIVRNILQRDDDGEAIRSKFGEILGYLNWWTHRMLQWLIILPILVWPYPESEVAFLALFTFLGLLPHEIHSLSLSHGQYPNVINSTHSPALSTSITTSVGAPLSSPLHLPSSNRVQHLVDQRAYISSFSVAAIKQFDQNNWRVGGYFQLMIPEAIEPITAESTGQQPGWDGMVTTGRG